MNDTHAVQAGRILTKALNFVEALLDGRGKIVVKHARMGETTGKPYGLIEVSLGKPTAPEEHTEEAV